MEEAGKFGAKLRELRIQATLSQRELASKVGVDFTYLSKIENGLLPPPSERVISKLCEVLNANKEELLALAGRIPSYLLKLLRARAMSEFGPRIRELRVHRHLTQFDLASKVGIGPTYLSKIENRVKPPPSRKVISRMAEVLEVDKAELMALAGRVSPSVPRKFL